MYRKGLKSWLKHLDFIVLDFIVVQLSFFVAYQLRHGWNDHFLSEHRNIVICLGLIDLLVMFFNDSCKGILNRGYLKEFKSSIKHVTYVNILFLIYLFTVHSTTQFSRIVFFSMWGIEIVAVWAVRSCWKWYLLKKKRNQFQRSMVVVTTFENIKACIKSLTIKEYDTFKITGLCIIDSDQKGKVLEGFPVVANQDDILDYIRRNWVDEVFIRVPKDLKAANFIVDGCNQMGVTVHLALAHRPFMRASKQLVEDVGDYTVLTTTMNVATNRQSFCKRLLDITGGLVGSILTVLLTLVIGPMIYLQSPGPIFFSQDRIGKNGKKFKMYKFRSMYMDAEERKKELMEQNTIKDGMMFKMDDDPRIIHGKNGKEGIGHFIRKTSLDEFPQFFNVLKGDMSLVGTRPPTPDEWEKYEMHHRARLAIKPGVTGMWQVSGRSDIKDFEEVVELDTQYIQQWNLGLDIKILFKTVEVVLKQEGTS